MFLPRVSPTLFFALAAVVGSMTYLGFALTSTNSISDSEHLGHLKNGSTSAPIQLAYVEHSPNLLREDDAKVISNLQIDSETLDPDDNCEFCTKVIYTPGKVGQAAIAYEVEKVDLTLSKRIVFFAKGQRGGEQVTFLAAGKTRGEGSGIVDNFDKDIFPNQGFGIMTHKVTLSNHWQRYQISLNSIDLRDITHPFGFVMTGGNSSTIQIFYLKGVTFDKDYAQDSLT